VGDQTHARTQLVPAAAAPGQHAPRNCNPPNHSEQLLSGLAELQGELEHMDSCDVLAEYECFLAQLEAAFQHLLGSGCRPRPSNMLPPSWQHT
jgi:hypothetical protein